MIPLAFLDLPCSSVRLSILQRDCRRVRAMAMFKTPATAGRIGSWAWRRMRSRCHDAIPICRDYLPVMVPGTGQPYPIKISRYHLGQETAAKDRLLGRLGPSRRKAEEGPRLPVDASRQWKSALDCLLEGNRPSALSAFHRQGFAGGVPDRTAARDLGRRHPTGRLQTWADDNLGLDCNGFVGNYLFYDAMGNDWRTDAPQGQPGPSALIDTIFHWASGIDESGVVDDLDQVSLNLKYLIARVDARGIVMPGGPGHPVGHIAITEPGQIMRQSFVHDSMGGIDPRFANLDMYNHFAMRTVESVGPRNIDPGISMNWMVFLRKSRSNNNVFEVRRDKILMQDTVKIAPVTKECHEECVRTASLDGVQGTRPDRGAGIHRSFHSTVVTAVWEAAPGDRLSLLIVRIAPAAVFPRPIMHHRTRGRSRVLAEFRAGKPRVGLQRGQHKRCNHLPVCML